MIHGIQLRTHALQTPQLTLYASLFPSAICWRLCRDENFIHCDQSTECYIFVLIEISEMNFSVMVSYYHTLYFTLLFDFNVLSTAQGGSP